MNVFKCFLGSTSWLVVTLGVAALGAYLLWNHSGHVLATAPYLLLLACPLMHLFGHHHGHNHPKEKSHE